jgi:hypothetical protein
MSVGVGVVGTGVMGSEHTAFSGARRPARISQACSTPIPTGRAPPPLGPSSSPTPDR